MKYTVEITRITYSSQTFEVEAKNKAEAEDLALDEAYNTEFHEGDAEYEVDSVTRNK
jgi:hypothetical protein